MADSCTGAADVTVPTGPYFVGDFVNIKIKIGATTIDPPGTIAISKFSYFLDCQNGGDLDNCIQQDNDIEFIEIVGNTCKLADTTTPVAWSVSEANEVVFTASNGAAVVAGNSFCEVDIKLKVNGLDPLATYPWAIFGSGGFRAADAICDNGLRGGADGNVSFRVEDCSLDLVKEVSADGGTNWFDANDEPGPDLEFPPGDALYRLKVDNTGSVAFTGSITYSDPILGFVDVVLPSGGLLPADAPLVITSGQISALDAKGRCTTGGAIKNTASAKAICRAETEVSDTDSDDAWVNCVPPPEIDITKWVSVDGGQNYFDANEEADYPPPVAFPAGAIYKIEVCNVGGVGLTNVVVNDLELNLVDVEVPDLAPEGELGDCYTLDDGNLEALIVAERCDSAGEFTNTATADGDSDVTGTPAEQASDPATMVCVGTPELTIVKKVSVDDGANYFDANLLDKSDWPPFVEYPNGAKYTIEVCNVGSVGLVEVVVNDAELGIVNYSIGELPIGECVELDSGDIPALAVAERCDEAGVFTNTAMADGKSAATGEAAPQVDDPANMECVPPPKIEITKEISVNGGLDWFDANDAASAPKVVFPGGAEYRFIVCNIGDVDLVNVEVADDDLGIVPTGIDDLAVGECETITKGDTGFTALDVPDRCKVEGLLTNVAEASGESAVILGSYTEDTDPANVDCVTQGQEICRTPGFWGARGGDEKLDRDFNYTQWAINRAPEGELSVCGSVITTTDLNTVESALEAICVAVKGETELQLVRQLTAAALNCVTGECNEYHENLVASCNSICATGEGDLNQCIAELDCFNNGNEWVDGQCTTAGTCWTLVDDEPTEDTGNICYDPTDNPDYQCGRGETCVPVENCHDREFCPDLYDDGELNESDDCFLALGPASSSKTCNEARKNNCDFFGCDPD